MRSRLALPVVIAASLALTGCATTTSPGRSSESPVGFAETTDASSASSAQGASTSIAEALDAVRRAAPGELDEGEPGVPHHSGASVDDVLRLGAVAVWIEEPSLFAVSLPAARDCWPAAGEPVSGSEHLVVVPFLRDESCAMPTSARTYLLQVPEDVDATPGIDLSLVGLEEEHSLRLPAS